MPNVDLQRMCQRFFPFISVDKTEDAARRKLLGANMTRPLFLDRIVTKTALELANAKPICITIVLIKLSYF